MGSQQDLVRTIGEAHGGARHRQGGRRRGCGQGADELGGVLGKGHREVNIQLLYNDKHLKTRNIRITMSLLYSKESYKITGALYEVHKELGPGLLEKVYQEALEKELRMQGIPFEREKRFNISYI